MVPIFGLWWRLRGLPAVAARCRLPWARPDEPPPAAVGDVAQLLHIHVQQIPGMGVFVAAHRLTGDPVEVREAVDPTAHQHPVRGGRRTPDPGGDLDRPEALLPAQVHDLAHHGRGGLAGAVVRA